MNSLVNEGVDKVQTQRVILHLSSLPAYLDMKLNVLVHRINMVKNIINNPRDDALHGGITEDSFHRVCLSGRSLSICKYGTIIATQDVFDDGKSRFRVDFVLGCIRLEHLVKNINFAL